MATTLPAHQTFSLPNQTTLDLVLVKPGTFIMGDEREGDDDEKPEHPVTITRPFYVGRYQVTQAQWMAVMDKNPAYFKGMDRPVETVSWQDIVTGNQDDNVRPAFLAKLTETVARENPSFGGHFRLPTEAEWEYAAKGGHLAPTVAAEATAADLYPRYAGGDTLTTIGWHASNAGQETHPVGQLQPNALGLYDLSGNVWEWCADAWDSERYEKRKNTQVVDPAYPGDADSYRVLRGGSWDYGAGYCRPAYRDWFRPSNRYRNNGFRLVWVPPVR